MSKTEQKKKIKPDKKGEEKTNDCLHCNASVNVRMYACVMSIWKEQKEKKKKNTAYF